MSTTEKAQDQLDTLADSRADSTDSEIRYLAYGARLRTALRAGTRYVAYVSTTIACISICWNECSLFHYLQTSDVGEAFRPVVSPYIVTAAYGISWLYLAGCVQWLAHSCIIQPDFVLQ